MSLQDVLRKIPGVDAVLAHPALEPALRTHGHALVVGEVRRQLESARGAAREGAAAPGIPALAAAAAAELDRRARGRLVEVLNATGVIVHTNLGRAPLGPAVLERVVARAQGAVNLELDLATGRRGRRAEGCEELLRELTGAEAALVVNNCAAALLLALNTFARDRAVIVSRGELVEIGGSFRIPEICERSGARLVEVGTTNRTRIADYASALDASGGALLLKVHPSNFRVVGFTEEASLAELVALGRSRGVPVLMDQGSGALDDLAPHGIEGEPAVRAMVADGADLVAFSGDKLLGGPQAGCLVGSSAAVGACRANPLHRALRTGRLTALALEATLWAHASGRLDDVPVQAQIRMPLEVVRARAEGWRAAIAAAATGASLDVIDEASTSGGGSSPDARIPTAVLRVAGDGLDVDGLAARLRAGEPAVVARIAAGALLLDPRTVRADRDAALAGAVIAALRG